MVAISAEDVAREVRDWVSEYVRDFGFKGGLWRFARATGLGVRRARGLYSGEARRIEAHEYLRAHEARATLRREQLARLRAELTRLEAADGVAVDRGTAGHVGGAVRGTLGGAGDSVRGPGSAARNTVANDSGSPGAARGTARGRVAA